MRLHTALVRSESDVGSRMIASSIRRQIALFSAALTVRTFLSAKIDRIASSRNRTTYMRERNFLYYPFIDQLSLSKRNKTSCTNAVRCCTHLDFCRIVYPKSDVSGSMSTTCFRLLKRFRQIQLYTTEKPLRSVCWSWVACLWPRLAVSSRSW